MFTHKWSLRHVQFDNDLQLISTTVHTIKVESDTYVNGRRDKAVKEAKTYCLIHGINYNECSVIHEGFS